MLPSKKSIRKMRTQPFPGWVLSLIGKATVVTQKEQGQEF